MIYRCTCGKLKNGQPYRLSSEVRFTCQGCMNEDREDAEGAGFGINYKLIKGQRTYAPAP